MRNTLHKTGAFLCALPTLASLYDYTTQHKMRALRRWDPTLAAIRYRNILTTPFLKDFTVETLREHDGGATTLYFSAGGWVYDATQSKAFVNVYPGWAGRDASISLCRLTLQRQPMEEEMKQWQHMTERDRDVLRDWNSYFDQKYPRVGRLEEWWS